MRVYVACFRMPTMATDLVLSFNSPVQISAKSSSAEMSDPSAVEQEADPMQATSDFGTMVDSLKIVDFGLFGQQEGEEDDDDGDGAMAAASD